MVNIIVVFPKLEDAKNIRNLLARNGYSVIGVCCTGAQVLQIIDNLEDGIVICGYRFNDMMYADLRESLASSFQMLLVASMHILESCDRRDIVSLPLPLRIGDLANTLEMMAAGMYRRRRRQKSQPKERSEVEKKVILDTDIGSDIDDAVALAYDKTVFYKKELNWRYLNGILRRWHEENRHTPEQAADEGRRRGKQPAPTQQQDTAVEKYLKW